MAVTTDIVESWRAPRRVVGRLLTAGRREDRALAFLMIGCFLIFVFQWPRLTRLAEQGGADLSQSVSYEFVAWLIIWPLALYLLTSLIAGVLALFKAPLAGYGLRLSLFWAILASAPGAMLYGLAEGFVGPGPATNFAGIIWVCGFFFIFGGGLLAARKSP